MVSLAAVPAKSTAAMKIEEKTAAQTTRTDLLLIASSPAEIIDKY
jgi:hypothetical protein